MKTSFITKSLFILLISASYSCLEPTGDEGSAIGKQSAASLEAGEGSIDGEDSGGEAATPALTFADVEPAITASCATSNCHSAAGGIAPILETAAQWRAVTDDTLDGDDRTNGEASADSIDPNGGGNPMPPVGIDPLDVTDRDNILEWIADGMP